MITNTLVSRLWVPSVFLLALATASCGDGGSSDNSSGSKCTGNEFRVSGEVGGTKVAIVAVTQSYGLVNIGTPTFGADTKDGASVTLTWASSVPDDHPTATTSAELTLDSAVDGNTDFCAGGGTVTIESNQVMFELKDLKVGPCPGTTAVAGTLTGCSATTN